MRVKAIVSQHKDTFGRLSTPLIRAIENSGADPFKCIYSFSHSGKLGYFWPSPEVILNEDCVITIPGFEGDGELKWVSKGSLKLAWSGLLRPLTFKDQFICSEQSVIMASGLILEQVRLIWDGALIDVHVAGQIVSLQVLSSEPKSDSPLILIPDTELEIEQPHSEPRFKAIKQSKPEMFSIVADPTVDHGFALFSLSDLIDQGWKTHCSKIYFKLQPLFKCMASLEFGLVGRAGSGKRVKKGTIRVNPSVFENGLLNTSYMKLSVVDVGEVEVTKAVSFKVSINHEDGKYLNEFKCDPSQFIFPSQLKKPNLVANVQSSCVFTRIDNSSQLELDYCLPPAQSINNIKSANPDESEVRRILDSMNSGLLLVKGEPGSGKSSIARNLSQKHSSILFDFESLLNNVGQTHLRLAGIFRDLEVVPLTTFLLFYNVEWILEPENLESLHEDERWALENLCANFVEFIEELLEQGRRIAMFISKNIKDIQRFVMETLVLSKALQQDCPRMTVLEKSHISWDQFMGNKTAKTKLEEAIIWPIKWSLLFKANNFPQCSAVLLYGHTGCGKTALMNSVISALPGVHLVRVRGPELLSKYIGSSEEAVRKVFQEARQHRPSLILFDEIDSLAPRRGHDNTGVTDRVVNQLLTEIDGTGDREGVFIIGTTSRKDLIDPALLRSGRIDIHIQLHLPDLAERSEIIEFLVESKNDSVHELAQRTEGMSPAQLKGFLCDAQLSSSDHTSSVLSLAIDNLSINTAQQISQDPPQKSSKLKATLA